MTTTKNNIPVGYKDSAVGIIPQEWEVRTFHEIGSLLGTNTLSRDKMNECSGCAQNIHYGDLLVKYGEILDCSSANIPWVNSDCRDANLGTNLQNGDVVISDTAEDHTVGKATEVQGVGTKIVLSGLHTIALRPNASTFAPNFLGYYFNSSIYRSQFYPLIQGIKVCSISKKAISNTKLAIPSIAEQKKIAEILEIWDEAIEKQSRLIEKLELRKRALMQRLLTGKTRLPGFTEPWQKVKFKQIFEKKNITFEESNTTLEILSVTKEGVMSQKEYFSKDIASEDISKYKLVERGDLAMSGLNFWMGSCHILTEYDRGLISPAYKVFCVNYNYNLPFIIHFVRGHAFKYSLIGCSVVGASIVRRNLDKEMLNEWIYLIPSLSEQKAIAEVLTTADNEIAIHSKTLDALRLQKRGLMQQLLTGKTRVKI